MRNENTTMVELPELDCILRFIDNFRVRSAWPGNRRKDRQKCDGVYCSDQWTVSWSSQQRYRTSASGKLCATAALFENSSESELHAPQSVCTWVCSLSYSQPVSVVFALKVHKSKSSAIDAERFLGSLFWIPTIRIGYRRLVGLGE